MASRGRVSQAGVIAAAGYLEVRRDSQNHKHAQGDQPLTNFARVTANRPRWES
ncbi:hypothetical protein Q31a_63040 [Aureliella helgolandensis]|uniref:Uncharacterized protein n=1 Tax=Aureliella helgolandensis TaxID=2527968 RepID=A0A518GH42_9BACT|nr:hypothetical protein Q31a_63040 [Aureliella helgolandensis]